MSNIIESPQQKLIELCCYIEPKLRPLGWNCAATGSALYGQTSGLPPEDLDVLLYRHNGWTNKPTRAFDALLACGFRRIEDCTEYPEFMSESDMPPKEHAKRKVFRVTLNGIKVDFLCIDELC